MFKPLVSIIVPIYNSEEYIEDCVNSIIEQSYSNLEIILINDGSKDASLSIINDLKETDDRIIVIDKKNGGVSKARNSGIQVSTGEYVVFIDSDDRIGKKFITNYIDILSQNPKALIYQSFISEYENKNVPEVLPSAVYFDQDIHKAIILLEQKRCLGGAWNKIFRTEIIKNREILFNEGFSYGEDKVFTLQYMQYVDCIILSSNTQYFYNRKYENSLSRKYHQSQELLNFVEVEFLEFNNLLIKYPNDELKKVINARYSSFLKYVLLSMYRKTDILGETKKSELVKKISKFDKLNERNNDFEIEVPKLVNYIYQSDFGMKFLMLLKESMPNLHKKFNRVKSNG
ncbi:glycosyltransferase family 2 protein [Chryseobacterium sp. TY3]